jgi:galactokinase
MVGKTLDKTSELRAAFRREFGADPELIARAPGRVNLIGEHTDYNEGFVLPCGIDREVLLAADSRGPLDEVQLFSLEYGDSDSFSLVGIEHSTKAEWSNYIRGVVDVFKKSGAAIHGFRAVITGNVPQGAGLSSSAALEVAVGTLLNALGELSLNGKEVALLAQKAENDFVGVKCGIMDQFASALSQADSALMIDCRDLSYASIPLNLSRQSVSLVITHTGVTRGLVSSKYNERRSECEEAVKIINEHSNGKNFNSLRDVDSAVLEDAWQFLPENVAKRARHVISENQRVIEAAECLKQGQLSRFGELMIQSHESLKNDYEVSCGELDTLVELSLQAPGVLGARMTGAGFGGCTVALVKRENVQNFIDNVLPLYEKQTGKNPSAYVCEVAPGASILR